ncbi:MAG: 1-acyl-sn-glycerol-3-phosphate acyltransferase, partial [Desulfovibrionaceae bacterium]|nr:1-acyl-sn-glycerol-3-phosphate acyltransferase [Desulfovibrionaceae bacterium]
LTVILVILRIALAFRYRLQVKGLQAVLDKAKEAGRPCLFLPNHPALIDPVILYSIIGRRFRPRPLADEAQANRPGLKKIFQKIIRVIVIPDVTKKGRVARQGVNEALQNVVKALAAGENVMLYPSGHTYRQQNEQISGNSGLDQVLKGLREMGRPLPTLIVARTSNLWGSRFSRAWGVYPRLVKVFRQGLLALPFNLFFFMPRRRVTVEFGIFEEFNALAAQSNKRREVNAWLENYYNEISAPAAAVPLYFWQGSEPVPLEQLQSPALPTAYSDIKISSAVWEQVQAHLQEISGREAISREMRLAADLDMDSLSIAELSVWIENEFGHNIADLDTLVTVNDVLAATQGRLTGKVAEQKTIPANWLSHERKGADIRLGLPACPNLEGTVSPSLPSLFLAQARKAPRRQILLDYSSGVKTYRSLLVGIEALRSKFIALPGERVGIMLPCSAAVISTYYAVLLACKTPVMVNWTLGVGNIKHCLNLSETEIIITARALTSRLVRQGF